VAGHADIGEMAVHARGSQHESLIDGRALGHVHGAKAWSERRPRTTKRASLFRAFWVN
jgi:hypothetical protein